MDARGDAIGSKLSQENDCGDFRLLTYTSRKLNLAEKNNPTHEREMLALVHALKKWKHYLMGSTVLAYTDNVALKYWRTAEKFTLVTFDGSRTSAC